MFRRKRFGQKESSKLTQWQNRRDLGKRSVWGKNPHLSFASRCLSSLACYHHYENDDDDVDAGNGYIEDDYDNSQKYNKKDPKIQKLSEFCCLEHLFWVIFFKQNKIFAYYNSWILLLPAPALTPSSLPFLVVLPAEQPKQ